MVDSYQTLVPLHLSSRTDHTNSMDAPSPSPASQPPSSDCPTARHLALTTYVLKRLNPFLSPSLMPSSHFSNYVGCGVIPRLYGVMLRSVRSSKKATRPLPVTTDQSPLPLSYAKLWNTVSLLSFPPNPPTLDLAQGGFRPQRSALDQALCLYELMQLHRLRHHRSAVIAFLDIKSAYDTVDRNVIWSALHETQAPLLSFL